MAVPIHYDGYHVEGHYRSVADAGERFLAAAAERPFEARLLRPGEALDLGSEEAAAA